MYSDADRDRWVPEPGKRPGRTPFQRDRARVLHSAALRRLAGKTQVVVPGEGDTASPDTPGGVPRTRLTHSLECGQIGRELGQALGCDPDLVEAACLAHDLGHPPFGHNGEGALDEAARACGGFEGNAQSLRLLTRLEPKAFAPDGRSVGLNLTRAGLDAVLKYPWPSTGSGPYGVYPDDLPVFAWVRDGAPERGRCLEAQVMDWSDDVAYCVHDLEDAVFSGRVDLADLSDPAERRDLLDIAAGRYARDAAVDELDEALGRLTGTTFWPAGFDGSRRAQARLKNTTSELIGRLCLAAERATRDTYGPQPLTRYAADLVVPRATRLECAVLKAVTAHYVMGSRDAARRRDSQRQIVADLVGLLSRGAPQALDPATRPDFEAAPDDAARLRVVVDQVASLTDEGARALHRALTGDCVRG